jgi:anti-anti-sigma factor
MALVKISHAQGTVPVTIFHILDRVNLGNFTELEKEAKDAYENGMRDLVIDLSKSESLTSIGIRALVIIHKMLSAEKSGSHLKLAGVRQSIVNILNIAGVTQFIEIYDTVEEAVASF